AVLEIAGRAELIVVSPPPDRFAATPAQ
ncbi:MAG: hypothetical protein CFH38_01562, partial [Alphaproteobacteria bacterium MarineAlpha10_Bin1]